MRVKVNLNKVNIRNGTCHCFDYIMRVIDIDFNNVLLDKKSYKKLLICNISYKTVMG